MKNGLNEPKTRISFLLRHTQLSPIILNHELGYSWSKIDHIADSLLKHQIKIGVHLINVELSQLLTLGGATTLHTTRPLPQPPLSDLPTALCRVGSS